MFAGETAACDEVKADSGAISKVAVELENNIQQLDMSISVLEKGLEAILKPGAETGAKKELLVENPRADSLVAYGMSVQAKNVRRINGRVDRLLNRIDI